MVFVDEPGLVALSAPDFPMSADLAVDLVSSALAAIEDVGRHRAALLRRHRLAPGAGHRSADHLAADRPPASPTTPARSASTSTAVAGSRGARSRPTDRSGAEPGLLWRALSETWCELVQRGCDALRLREQALVTPECGLAGHDPVQAESILALSVELAERVRRQSFGVRLAVGA